MAKFGEAEFCKQPKDILRLAEIPDEENWDTSFLAEAASLEAELDKPPRTWRFREAIFVNSECLVRRRKYPNKHYKMEGRYIIERVKVWDQDEKLAVMPHDELPCRTKSPIRMTKTVDMHVAAALEGITSFDQGRTTGQAGHSSLV